MSLFTRKAKVQLSPWGEAAIRGDIVSVYLGRFRGVCIDLSWPVDAQPKPDRVEEVKKHILERWDAALEFLGVAEFPRELPVIVPENIHFPADEQKWEMTFFYPKWEGW